MHWNNDWSLYVIIDAAVLGARDLASAVQAAIDGGADLIQYRNKRAPLPEIMHAAEQIAPVCRQAQVPLIINDHVEAALHVQAAGVHLGQDDLPIPHARARAGAQVWIGQSTHSLAQARHAVRSGADYIGVGPVFPTPTKPDSPSVGVALVQQAAQHIDIPWVAIGGIDHENVDRVLEAGAQRVAVVRAVTAAQNIAGAARALKQRLMAHASL